MFCALALWTVITFAWAFLTLRTRWLLYPAWAFSGAVSAGIVLAQLTLLMKLMPPAARAGAVSIERRKPRHRRGALDLVFVIRTSIRIEHVGETGFTEWKR